MHEVVVTGMGVVSPLGNSVAEFTERMFAGESGIRNIRGTLVADDFPVAFAGVVDDSQLPSAEELGIPANEMLSKNLRFGVLSAREAVKDLPTDCALDGMVFGTAAGVFFEMVLETLRQKPFDAENFWWDRTRSEFGAEMMAADLHKLGYNQIPTHKIHSVNSACASGNHAVGNAFQMLRSGRWQRCLAGGVDSGGWESNLMNFHLLNALTTADVEASTASRPFSLDRAGFVKSEASAVLLMETREAAEARGAKILAKVSGFGLTSDAYRLTDGREDGVCVVRAMQDAISDAGLAPKDIDYVNAHGTSTPLNDRLETIAIKEALGDHAYQTPISSLKSQVGHSTVAAGALESVACVQMLQEQRLAPTINLHTPDPECDLDYVPNQSRKANVQNILSNNLGFGGQNACLVFQKA